MIYTQSLRDLCLYASVTHCESMRKEHTLNLRISTKILKIRKYAISCCESQTRAREEKVPDLDLNATSEEETGFDCLQDNSDTEEENTSPTRCDENADTEQLLSADLTDFCGLTRKALF